MNNTDSMYVEKLDSGYIVTLDGKKIAKHNLDEVRKLANERMNYMVDQLTHADVSSLYISIKSIDNPPQEAK